MALQFQHFNLFRSCPAHNPGEVEDVDPVIVVLLPDPPPKEGDAMVVYEVGSSAPLLASIIDGYHRLFLARLFSVERVPCRAPRGEIIANQSTACATMIEPAGTSFLVHAQAAFAGLDRCS